MSRIGAADCYPISSAQPAGEPVRWGQCNVVRMFVIPNLACDVVCACFTSCWKWNGGNKTNAKQRGNKRKTRTRLKWCEDTNLGMRASLASP